MFLQLRTNLVIKKMDDLLARFFEKIESSLKREFYQYIMKISQVKGSFYMLIRKPRGKILGDDLNILFEKVGGIYQSMYTKNLRGTHACFATHFSHTLNL